MGVYIIFEIDLTDLTDLGNPGTCQRWLLYAGWQDSGQLSFVPLISYAGTPQHEGQDWSTCNQCKTGQTLVWGAQRDQGPHARSRVLALLHHRPQEQPTCTASSPSDANRPRNDPCSRVLSIVGVNQVQAKPTAMLCQCDFIICLIPALSFAEY